MSEEVSRLRLHDDLNAALKGGEETRVSVLRMLLAALHNKEIEKRGKGEEDELTNEETRRVLASEAKKRREAREAYRRGGRSELAAKEERELGVIQAYLPRAVTREEITVVVRRVLLREATREFGPLMRAVLQELKAADGKDVADVLKAELGTP